MNKFQFRIKNVKFIISFYCRIALFGQKMPQLCQLIESNNFKKKPIGPLGMLIDIKKDVSEIEKKLIECELSGMFNNFIVDNFDDRRLLDRLAKNIKCPIGIITSKFLKTRHDISAGKCQSNVYPSIIGKSLLFCDHSSEKSVFLMLDEMLQ